MSRVCVTGAAGFIASHVIIDLLEDGHVVHATVRDLGDDTKRAHLDVLEERYPGKLQCFEADLLEPGSLDAALEGCDALIHTATAVILAAPDPQKQIIDVAVKGTQNVLDSVARTPSVKRIVMTSSIAAVMSYDQQDRTYTEDDWCTSDDIGLDPYGMGKTQSERLLWQFVDEHADRVQAVAINPSVVIGPPLAKHHIRSSLSFIRDLVGWSYPACAPMRLHLVDVGDVSKGHVRALTSNEAVGQRIIFSDRQKSILEISKVLSRQYKTPMRELPRLILYIAAYLDKRFSLRLARASANLHYEFGSNRPMELLGIDLRNTEESILEAAETMVEKGWVKPRS
ncbi:MAG: NAD-dependent epimerase/dehydratase family protein [Gammaproteobacteria bacterium]|jgi:dihydroflavonol-4-reductase|nr:NAD-dependent epimerase/dehydratase family protein [Gammaproteobacteria bacterium]MDH3756882.1 NAD-dependent epimerase/dehydratase family protein [Gammaproteobacteria bacterium]MDH3820108.1 NAD-dependent epimerase/dehydratase family protein [Gammaproteobacteria bacterium]MDH3847013.1 NAD-dependent epimerase/dehydratase family protein [Gammaproteobacteria bacterium]MDH3906373.1 NAD-dependent epimerase/dehydratase family protein [Gammaproteobacteria bacterium]